MKLEKKVSMDDCIRAIPDMIRKNTADAVALTEPLVCIYREKNPSHIVIVASGSSYNACVTAGPYMQKTLGKVIRIIQPFTFEHYDHDHLSEAMVLFVSQSGNSTNILSAMRFAATQGLETIGLTSDMDSDLARGCMYAIDYQIGKEAVGFVTLGMTGLALYLMLFALNAAREEDNCSEEAYCLDMTEFRSCPDRFDDVYRRTKELFETNLVNLISTQHVFVCGCGPGYGVALEGALKIGETFGVPTSVFETEEYLHGPAFNVNGNYTVLFVDNDDETSVRLHTIYEATREFTCRAYMISASYGNDSRVVKCPKGNPYISVLYKLTFFQYLAYLMTEEMNRWPNERLAARFDAHTHIKSK